MSDLLRLIDANLNRASEGLRVMEDLARFVLNDPNLAGELKRARHELRRLAEAFGLDPAILAAWRDTPGDVGTVLSTETERVRPGTSSMAIAAGKRVGEALRVLEEAGKFVVEVKTPDAGLKSLRYRVYDAEKRLTLAMGSGRARQWRLCVVISESLCLHHPWPRVAELAIAGGAECVQLREKGLQAGELLARARALVRIARGTGTTSVVVNDRPDIALLAEADGVHVGQQDLSVTDVRRVAGSRLLVGVSTANLAHALAAADAGADYCGLGPMFATRTKESPTIAGPEYLRSYVADNRVSGVPHLAIGGIDAVRATELARQGCRGVAVSSAVCSSTDPRAVCEQIVRALG